MENESFVDVLIMRVFVCMCVFGCVCAPSIGLGFFFFLALF